MAERTILTAEEKAARRREQNRLAKQRQRARERGEAVEKQRPSVAEYKATKAIRDAQRAAERDAKRAERDAERAIERARKEAEKQLLKEQRERERAAARAEKQRQKQLERQTREQAKFDAKVDYYKGSDDNVLRDVVRAAKAMGIDIPKGKQREFAAYVRFRTEKNKDMRYYEAIQQAQRLLNPQQGGKYKTAASIIADFRVFEMRQEQLALRADALGQSHTAKSYQDYINLFDGM